MPDILIIDFETRSRVDLKAAGTDTYATDPSTKILCLAAYPLEEAPENESLKLAWTIGNPNNENITAWCKSVKAFIQCGGLVAAFNARFDQLIWECIGVPDHGFPVIPAEQWYCIAAQCRVNALPGNLDDAARALKVKHKKNNEGSALIRKLCIPQANGQFYDGTPEERKRFLQYCVDDVMASRDVMLASRMLSPQEHEDWLASERVNDHGIKIDREMAELAVQCAQIEAEALSEELTRLTNGAVTKPTQTQRIKEWLLPRLNAQVTDLTVTYDKGKRKNSLAKDIRQTILNMADEGAIEIDDDCYNVIAVLDEGSRSSVSKFKSMLDRADPETDRVHGAFLYAGAATLRYTSRGLQLHNIRRDAHSFEEAEKILRLMRAGQKPSRYEVMDTLSKLLRTALIPDEGNVFVVGDWKSIENRVLPWLSNDPRAERKLKVFRNFDAAFKRGEKAMDTYELAAQDAGIQDRQVGKVIELSLGYGGAAGAFKSMAKNYGVYLPDYEIARIVQAWRRNNPWAVSFWAALEKAAKRAIRTPGLPQEAGKILYYYIPDLMGGSLLCELPGEHFITYPAVRIEEIDGYETITALKANWKPKADAKEWPRFKLWGGLLSENVTQAFAAALLRHCIRHDSLKNVALHCHDELALEVPEHHAELYAQILQTVMETTPEWAEGLPLLAPPTVMRRYGKE